MKKIFVSLLSMLLVLGSFSTPVLAAMQAGTGTLVGTVSGPDGVIGGATILVTDNQTAKERKVVTTDEGTFRVDLLPFGDYTVNVTANGFKTFSATSLKIDVGKEYSLPVMLEVGAITDTVTVTAGADLVHGDPDHRRRGLARCLVPRGLLRRRRAGDRLLR